MVDYVAPGMIDSTAGSLGFRNRIINGAFDIWQRGTSFTSSSVNEYSADRWRTEGYNTSSVISQQTFTVGQTAVPGYPRYFCRVTTSSAPSNYWAFQQRIECPQNINGDGMYTLSFWVKAVSGTIAAGTFKYGINDNSTYSNPAITTTWQKITITQTLSGLSESGGYILIYIVSIGTGVSSLSVDIANVQVEAGSIATAFERRPYGLELALCQRYYWKTFNIGTLPASLQGSAGALFGASSVTNISFSVTAYFPVPMRTTPTMTYYSPNQSGSNWSEQSGYVPTLVQLDANEKAVALRATTSVAAGGAHSIHIVASAEL